LLHPVASTLSQYKLSPAQTRFVFGQKGWTITLLHPVASTLSQYKLSPAQTRFVFGQKGWTRVVGFHTRNVPHRAHEFIHPHRAHEFIQLKALEETHADGLLISPVIGSPKAGDFLPEWIMKSYQLMIDFGVYPRDKVLLTCFATYPRYCGPREAVCRVHRDLPQEHGLLSLHRRAGSYRCW
jgi:ATP sulfurylase